MKAAIFLAILAVAAISANAQVSIAKSVYGCVLAIDARVCSFTSKILSVCRSTNDLASCSPLI
jgi:hypothetical protein